MTEFGSGYCGRRGRIARANLRGGEPTEDDLSHIRGCSTCQQRIIDCIRNNHRTTYVGNSIEQAISQYKAMQRRRCSWSD